MLKDLMGVFAKGLKPLPPPTVPNQDLAQTEALLQQKAINAGALQGQLDSQRRLTSQQQQQHSNLGQALGTGLPVPTSSSEWTTGITTASFTIFPNASWNDAASDFVFRGNDEIPNELFIKRIKKLRKKHPEYFECIETMEKKAYGKKL